MIKLLNKSLQWVELEWQFVWVLTVTISLIGFKISRLARFFVSDIAQTPKFQTILYYVLSVSQRHQLLCQYSGQVFSLSAFGEYYPQRTDWKTLVLILFRETKGRYEYCRKSTVCNTNCRLQATRYFENLALTFPEWFTQLVTSLEHWLTSDTTNKSCSVRQSTLQKRNISGLQIVRKIFFGL